MSDWDARRADHRAAVERFLESAEAVQDGEWAIHPRQDKWSPAQIAEHLVLTYDAMLRELKGGVGLRLRGSWWRRLVIRLRFLPMVLKQGRLPSGAPAVREVRPGDATRDKAELVRVFRERALQFDEGIGAAHHKGGVRLTHPFFGRLDASQALKLVAVHIEHHRKQLPQPSR